MPSVEGVASLATHGDQHRRRRRPRMKQKSKQQTTADDLILVPLFLSDSHINTSGRTLGTKSTEPARLHKLSEKFVTIDGKQLDLFRNKYTSLSENSNSNTQEDHMSTVKGPSSSSSSSSSSSNNMTTRDLFLFDSETCKRIHPNEFLHRIDTDDLSGYMLAMMSTSDHNVPHFNGRKRKVELQFQIKFKNAPKYPLFIGCELKGSTRISAWQKTLLKAMAAGMERRNKSFRYNLETSDELQCENKYEIDDHVNPEFHPLRGPYMAMPFESSVNALVVTKKGDMPPILGEAIQQVEQSSRLDRIEINTSDTYTFALWTANFDLPNWKCTSRSAIQAFSLNTLIGGQPFSLSLYSMNPSNHKIKRYFELEISHKLSQAGPARNSWLMQKHVLHSSPTDSLLDMVSDVELIRGPKMYYPEDDRNDMDSSCQRSCVCWSDWE
mmetsp:Transcript_4816/g.9185  ORF Transcript_4816/g.9185 Transcript_4816/m.9185 type:complete len:439 (-) Transcript_4816:156-1472(-)